MQYIKFRLKSRSVDPESGRLTSARIGRMNSNTGASAYDLQLILHALSAAGWAEETAGPFILDTGQLDNELWLLG